MMLCITHEMTHLLQEINKSEKGLLINTLTELTTNNDLKKIYITHLIDMVTRMEQDSIRELMVDNRTCYFYEKKGNSECL